jgi:hypothetical protein
MDEATLPCDWIRSSIDGLIQWLRHDFEGFSSMSEKRYDVVFKGCPMVVFRSQTHSFWHDDLRDAATQEKLNRRVDRFLNLAVDPGHEHPRSLLFVRSVACSAELSKTETLLDLLKERFESQGRKVYLLVVIDGQPFAGPVLHAVHEENLLFWLQPTFTGRLALDCSAPAPYEEAIAFALRRILDGPNVDDELEWPRVQQASDIVQEDGALWTLGVRGTDCGLWVGEARVSGASEESLFAAFEGFDDAVCVETTRRTSRTPPVSRSPSVRRSDRNPAWLGA